MILHHFENENKSSTVSHSQGEFIVMKYIDNNYIDEEVALNEEQAEIKAEDWVINASTG
jgi:hypothetical protein